ncbi:MAG: hypothetical protein LBK00_10490 [Treponema sp.]|nr:hypothetical protein [Treponema sp.]
MEKGFFATRRKLKLTLSAMVLVAALLSQIRYGGKILVNTIEGLVAVFLIVGIGAFLLRHRIQNIYKKHAETDAVASPLSSPAEPEAAASSLSLSVGTDVAASSLSPLAEPEAVSPLSSPAEPEAVGLPFSPPAKILTLPHDKFDSQDVVVI